jgi:hypothetical protein
MAGNDFSSTQDQVAKTDKLDAVDTLNARLDQMEGILQILSLSFTSKCSIPGADVVRQTLWGVQTLLDEARIAAGTLRA